MKRIIAAQFRWSSLLRLFSLFILLCLISGCLQIDYYITINYDGSESVTEKIAAIKELKLDKMENQLKAQGYNTTREIRNDSVYLTATQTFPSGKWVFPYPAGMVKDSVKLSQAYNNYLFVKKFKLNASYTIDSSKVSDYFASSDSPGKSDTDSSLGTMMKETTASMKDMGAGLLSIPLRYHIQVPGKIDTTTASAIVVNTMNWTYKLEGGQNINILFSSTQLSYTYLIILGIVIVAVLFYLVVKRKIGT